MLPDGVITIRIGWSEFYGIGLREEITGEAINAKEARTVRSLFRSTEYLRAAALTAKEVRCLVFGGFVLAAGRLMDMTEIMTAIYLLPETVHQLVKKCTLFIKEYVRAYKSFGIEGIVMAEPAAGLLGEEECDRYSSAYIKEIVTELQDETFLVVLHNCGHDGMLARSMASTGAGALHFGNAADMEKVLQEVPNDVLVMGNLDPVRVLKEGTPEFVKEQTQTLLEKTKDYAGFILSSGAICRLMYRWKISKSCSKR